MTHTFIMVFDDAVTPTLEALVPPVWLGAFQAAISVQSTPETQTTPISSCRWRIPGKITMSLARFPYTRRRRI